VPSPITLRTAGDERNGETIHLHPGGFPQGWVIRHQPARAPDQTPAGLSGGQRSVSKYPHNLALDLYTHSLVAFRRAPSGARWGRATAAWADRGADARCASIVPSSAGSADATSRQAPNGAMHVSVLIADNAACGRRMRPPKDEAPAHDYAAPRPGLVLTASEAVCLVARASLASDPAGLSISSLSG
jgi:hypothetical protein